MNYILNNLLKKIIPRKVTRLISDTFQYYSFRGNYKSFEDIKIKITKYDSKKVIDRVANAYEISYGNCSLFDRDGEIVKNKNQNLQLLKVISNILVKKKLNCVIDFGGSLANFYRNNSSYLRKYNLKWIVIDNKNICNLGKALIKDKNIFFFENIEKTKNFSIRRKLKPTFFLFGSSIQYIENFENILKQMFKMDLKTIIIDRQPVLRSKESRYVIQKTPPWAGNLSYAVKLYKSRSLINLFLKYNYYLDKNFVAFGNKFLDGEYKSYIFKKR